MVKKLFVILLFLGVFSACEKNTQDAALPGDSAFTPSQKMVGEQNDSVLTINGITIKKEQFDFYVLMNKVTIELQRHANVQVEIAKKTNANRAYWEEQLQQVENENVQLQSVIEWVAMALLAEEKGYVITKEELQQQLDKYRRQLKNVPHANAMVTSFGETLFEKYIAEYVRIQLLRDDVIADLREQLEQESEFHSDRELNYLLQERYEDLFVDQVKSLQIEIHAPK